MYNIKLWTWYFGLPLFETGPCPVEHLGKSSWLHFLYTFKIKSKNWVISCQISLWEKCLEHFIYKVTNRIYCTTCRPIWLNNIYLLFLPFMWGNVRSKDISMSRLVAKINKCGHWAEGEGCPCKSGIRKVWEPLHQRTE